MPAVIYVNGARQEIEAQDQRALLDILRNELGLKGAHFGCGAGSCGACTVLVDGVPARACAAPLWSVEGKEVVTLEGLARHDAGGRMQQALIRHAAAQCGCCA